MGATVRINLLFFAAIEELMGRREAALEVEATALTAGDLPELLQRRFPELEGRLASVRLAVNESFAQPGDPVCDGDTVALIPPVSGG